MGHSLYFFKYSSVKVKNLPLFTTISHKKVFHSFFEEVIRYQLSVSSYQASDICYSVAEVLEARFLKVGKELAVSNCQASDN
jgi:hypothetical protein